MFHRRLAMSYLTTFVEEAEDNVPSSPASRQLGRAIAKE